MTSYETPAFDPGIAFSWTLRSEEIARRRLRNSYETPAFVPGIAFSWTLRAAEIARRGSRQPLSSAPDSTKVSLLAAA